MSCTGINALDPICVVATSIGHLGSSVTNSVFSSVATAFGNTADSAINWLWSQMTSSTSISFLDSYVVPACWYEHESLVVALQALKDHERVAYDASSPASSATDWHRAFRDISGLLRQFTADLRCGHGPEYAQDELFDTFVTNDIARRRRRAATVALGLGDQDDLSF